MRATDNGKYLPNRGLRGHALRNVNLMNRSLLDVRENVKRLKTGRRAEDRRRAELAVLIVETRVLVLKMTVDAFSTAAKMHKHAVLNAERPHGRPQHESMSRIYRTWCKFEVPQKTRNRLLELLIPEQDERGQPWRKTVEGLYRKWMYEAGQQAFRKASQKANQNRTLTYGTLWQRHAAGVVPDFEEVRIIATELGQNLAEAAEIWSEQKRQQLLARGVNEVLIQFLVQLQVRHDGLWMHEKSLVKRLGVTTSTATALANCRMPPLQDVVQLIPDVIAAKQRKSFLAAWETMYAKLGRRETFAVAFERIRDANGWNNQLISSLLRIRPPEVRAPSGKPPGARRRAPPRREPYRPSAELRRMYRNCVFSSQAPAKCVIELVGRDDVRESTGGETQKEYLTSLFLEAVAERLRLQGSALERSRLRMYRVLCGTSAEQLASLSEFSRDDILLIEQGRIPIEATVEQRLIDAAERLAMQKVERARQELHRLNTPPETVAGAVSLLVQRLGGHVPLSRLLQSDSEPPRPFSPATLKQIQAGTIVPALPRVTRMVELGQLEVSDTLVRDWYQQMPEYLANRAKMRWRHPLVRGVGTIVLEQAHSMYDFWEQHCRDDFTYSVMTRNFQQMNGRGNIDWPTVSRYLNAAGLDLNDPRRLYLQDLFAVREQLTDSLRKKTPRDRLALVAGVLRAWRRKVRGLGHDPAAFEYRLGLTVDELQANATRSGSRVR